MHASCDQDYTICETEAESSVSAANLQHQQPHSLGWAFVCGLNLSAWGLAALLATQLQLTAKRVWEACLSDKVGVECIDGDLQHQQPQNES